MSKLTYEDKKEIIRLYDEAHLSYMSIAKKMNLGYSTVMRIVRRFHLHGEDSLIKKKNRIFPPDLKLYIIQRVLNGESKASVSIEYQIREAMIINWLQKYQELGYDGLIDKPKGRSPSMKKNKKIIDPNDKDAIIKQKDQRILELEAEVEVLKKLNALVQERNKRQTKKK